MTSAAAIDGLHRLTWEIAAVAASRVKRKYLLENELDQARRARGADLTPDEADEIERALARWEYTKERAARLRRTGSLPGEEMARLQERIVPLLWTAEEHVERTWVLPPEHVETVLLALYLATWVPRLREHHAKWREQHAHALSALYAAMSGDAPGLSMLGEPQKSLNSQLRVMANRLLGRKDHTPLRAHLLPVESILQDWENLTRPRDANWEPRSVRLPDIDRVVSKREALQILKDRYVFNSEDAVVRFLGRQHVRGLPAIRKR